MTKKTEKKRRFKLLKDMPDLEAGATFKQTGTKLDWYTCYRKGDDGHWCYAFCLEALERNKEWFKEL